MSGHPLEAGRAGALWQCVAANIKSGWTWETKYSSKSRHTTLQNAPTVESSVFPVLPILAKLYLLHHGEGKHRP